MQVLGVSGEHVGDSWWRCASRCCCCCDRLARCHDCVGGDLPAAELASGQLRSPHPSRSGLIRVFGLARRRVNSPPRAEAMAATGVALGGGIKALPRGPKITAQWGADTYRDGGLMSMIEHINYRHAYASGFQGVSRYAQGTSARDIKGYVGSVLRHEPSLIVG